MDLTLDNARLVERRSDELDNTGLVNEMRATLQEEGRFFREATTTDATATVIWNMDIALNTSLWVDVVVMSFHPVTGDGGASWRSAWFKNFNGTGASGAVAMTFDDYTAGGVVALARTGVNLTLTVTGVAATTIGWHARILALEAPWARV